MSGDAYVYANAVFFDQVLNAQCIEFYGDTRDYRKARVYSDALIYGDVKIFGKAKFYRNAVLCDTDDFCNNEKLSYIAAFPMA
ncbi:MULTISPECIES: hypothetical protein [Bartonella]|uniref:Phage related protein n=1 Tax=Bartonella grahamii TaxID=33045 RepID=A0A336NC62_BARGR|nr:hypothetical protein [Bartonella grahamii]SSZ39113.1 Uncharacterised protein [Bartonella grahamii]